MTMTALTLPSRIGSREQAHEIFDELLLHDLSGLSVEVDLRASAIVRPSFVDEMIAIVLVARSAHRLILHSESLVVTEVARRSADARDVSDRLIVVGS
jgi:hypothetical protein